MTRILTLLAVLALGGPAALAATKGADAAPMQIAHDAGCLICHQIDPGGKGPDGLPPIGPAWREVALKYQGQKGAAAQLTHTVLTGSNPYDSHWKGKVSGLAMPANAVAIGERDARRLVKWILSLEPPAPAAPARQP
jgi:cytochrome c